MDRYLSFIDHFRDQDPALCETVAKLWNAVMEASATDVNPTMHTPRIGQCSQGIIPNQTTGSKDPFIQSLIDRSYFGRFGQGSGFTIPGRTTLGLMGGGTDKPGAVSTNENQG